MAYGSDFDTANSKQAELGSIGGLRQEPGWHIRRLADLAEIERELKALVRRLRKISEDERS